MSGVGAWLVAAVLAWGGQGATPEELWRAGRREEALEAWWREQERAQGDRARLLRIVEAELAVHRYAAALEHARGLGAEGAAARGTALYRLGRPTEALGELGRGSAAELAMRVDALEMLQRFEEADRDLAELARRTEGKSASVEAMLGRSAVRRGDREAGERHFRRALELDPVEPGALHGLGLLLRSGERKAEGMAFLQRHREVTPLLDQLEFAQRGVDLGPTHAANHAAVGDAQRVLGRIDAALEAYRTADRLASGDALVPVALRHARLLAEDRKDVASAVRVLESGFERCGNAKLLVRAGDLLADAGERAGARERWTRALALRPQDAEIQARLEGAGAQR
ncbi:MAG: hypothetical protein ACKO4Q_17655 [Planctomycetota bacterium]